MNNKTISSIKCILYLFGWLVMAMPAQAASFDCSKASNPQEKLICFDYRLSDLDSQLAWTYTAALKQAKDTGALKQSQKDWVAARGKCTDVNCILHAYLGKIEALVPGTKLDEVYFPKGSIPWDFSAQPGYRVTGYTELKGNKLEFTTFPKGDNTPAVALIIPEDEHGLAATKSEHETSSRLQNLVTSLVNSEFEFDLGEFIELGGVRLGYMSSSYGECRGGLGTSGIFVARSLPWTKNNILVPLRPHKWTVWKRNDPDCHEAQLKIDPTLINAVVFKQSLYFSENHADGDYVLRLDHNLQTASSLLGKKIYLGWGSDLEGLTGKACDKFVGSFSTESKICIDQQLQKLIGEVGRFYN